MIRTGAGRRRGLDVLGLIAPLLVAGCMLVPHPRASEDELREFLERAGAPRPGRLTATFFETGLGDASLIEFPSGRTLLVDAGIGWRADQVIDFLRERGIRRIDGMLLTHAHRDHYGGMERIARGFAVGAFYDNGVPAGTRAYRRLIDVLDRGSVPRIALARGDALDSLAGEGVSIEVLYPDGEALAQGGNRNHATIVLRIRHGQVRLLLAGDAEKEEERRLLALERGRLEHEFLKLGHHACPGSGTAEFLRAVRPRLAVAMGTGVINVPLFYPKPNYRIRRVLEELDTEFLTPQGMGVVQVISDGRSLEVRSL